MYRARLAHRAAAKAIKKEKYSEATHACNEMMFLLTIEKIRNPFVELDNVAHLVVTMIQVSVKSLLLRTFPSSSNLQIFRSDPVQRKYSRCKEEGQRLGRQNPRQRFEVQSIGLQDSQDLGRSPKDNPQKALSNQSRCILQQRGRREGVQAVPGGQDRHRQNGYSEDPGLEAV